MRTIAVAVDRSSKETIEFLLTKIATPKDVIILVHVRPEAIQSPIFSSRHSHLVDPNPQETQKRQNQLFHDNAMMMMNQFKEYITSRGFQVKFVVLSGTDPRPLLELYLKQLKPDFIIIGKHSQNAFSEFLMGSVTKHLLYTCPIPILILPPMKN